MPRRLCALAFAALLVLPSATADVFTRARKLYTVKTEHFTFIFPKESRGAAEGLAREAEGIYAELAEAFGVGMTLRIPVVISPDAEEANGACYSYPSTRIVLYQAPISPNDGFAVFDDDLKKIFLHELVHAVTQTIRDPFWAFLASLFTDAITPAFAIAPGSLVEGAAVSMESRDGFGRAADTDYLGMIQQDIIEGRFKDYPQASGFWSGYPVDTIYVYGGAFSRYLQETHGMPAYADLWRRMGRGNVISGLEGFLFFKGAFEEAYGMELAEAWKGFREYASLKRPVVTALAPLQERYEDIGAACADASRFIWSESTAVKAYDPATGKAKKLFNSDGTPNRLSVSPDGARLLVSSLRIIDGMPRLRVRTWDLERRRWESVAYPNRLREAAWLGEGIVACRTNGSAMDLVRIEKGAMEVLLKGSERLLPSFPCPFGEGEIAFLLKIDGRIRLARMELSTKAVRVLEPGAGLGNVRYLSSDGRTLSFSWDSDGSLYKLGRYREGAGLELHETPISGGVRYPVALGDATYYVGAFSRGCLPMLYPADDPALSPAAVGGEWRELDPALASAPSAYLQPPAMETRAYDPLPWLLLPQLRYPYPTFMPGSLSAENLDRYVNGAGIRAYGEDPTRAQSLDWEIAYKWFDGFAEARAAYACTAFPASFSVSAHDSLSGAYAKADPEERFMSRRLGIGASANQAFVLEPLSRSVTWQAYAAWDFLAEGRALDGSAAESPYLWPFADSILPFGVLVGYQDLNRPAFEENGKRGYSLRARYQAYLEPFEAFRLPGFVSAQAALYLPLLNLSLVADGAVSAYPGLGLGVSGPRFADGEPYRGGAQYPYYGEYAGTVSEGPFFLRGDAGLGHSFRVQEAIRGTDIYAKGFDLRSGYRASYSGGVFLHSLYARASLAAGWARGVGLNSGFVRVGLELDWLLTPGEGLGASPILLSPVLSLEY